MSKTAAAAATTFAPLKNVALAVTTMGHLVNRAPNMPGMGVMFGQSGLGKSTAMAYTANKYRAVYVECRSYLTKKSLLLLLMDEMGLRPGKTIYEMVKQIGEELVLSRRPVIIDEMDHIVDRNLVELVRDIYEVSNAPILMVGEERFPAKLKRWERFHNRVLDWVPAEPTDLADARRLVQHYSSDVAIDDDLLKRIVEVSRGVARRVVVNIENVRQEAKKAGKRTIDADHWGQRPFYTGEAPVRRAA